MPTLTKPCHCRWCKQPMAVGEPFKWHKAKRPVQGYTNGTNGTVGMKECWKPGHVHDCLSAKAVTDRAKWVDEQCAVLSGLGASAGKIAEYRAHLEKP